VSTGTTPAAPIATAELAAAVERARDGQFYRSLEELHCDAAPDIKLLIESYMAKLIKDELEVEIPGAPIATAELTAAAERARHEQLYWALDELHHDAAPDVKVLIDSYMEKLAKDELEVEIPGATPEPAAAAERCGS
jgi:hypothetical protein